MCSRAPVAEISMTTTSTATSPRRKRAGIRTGNRGAERRPIIGSERLSSVGISGDVTACRGMAIVPSHPEFAQEKQEAEGGS